MSGKDGHTRQIALCHEKEIESMATTRVHEPEIDMLIDECSVSACRLRSIFERVMRARLPFGEKEWRKLTQARFRM